MRSPQRDFGRRQSELSEKSETNRDSDSKERKGSGVDEASSEGSADVTFNTPLHPVPTEDRNRLHFGRKKIRKQEKREHKVKNGHLGRRKAEISRNKVKEAIARLKINKLTGEVYFENEALEYGGLGVREEIWRICNKVWKGEGRPKEWKTGLVDPLIKKGESKKVEEYRGITLMSAGYNIYEEALRRRKKTGTIDNVYVLNYLVNRNLGRKKGKLGALFADFKAAFNSVNRMILSAAIKEKGVDESSIERIKKIFLDTNIRVKMGDKKGEEFWTGSWLRQGYPLSPILFGILLANLEEQ
ncbi:uncharacterized protein LOC117169780 [Belonocnema kinseyi]|uniref:uncharacterized protein LOC117169780 n=1 Tax=Belonocnema kinseyi TaxID=2817044 RepID=UPI00143D1507|nr:uncharacterized protein LOC117169780 [Belonocnema kinseyi]